MTSQALQQKEQTAQFIWTVFILMFFVIQAVIWTVAITITASDTSHAVVAGYDEEALHWDDVRRERTASAALGWTSELKVSSSADLRDFRIVTVQLADRHKQPVENAILELDVFHRGRAANVQTISFNEMGPGVYSAKIRIDRTGFWQFSGFAKQDTNQFIINERVRIKPIKKGS